MSYDLAVWEGPQPRNDKVAGAVYEELFERYLEADQPEPVTPRIAAYVEALVAKYPDDPYSAAVWSSTPVIGGASGPIVLLYLRADVVEVGEFAAALAEEHGLVLYDPQAEMVMP